MAAERIEVRTFRPSWKNGLHKPVLTKFERFALVHGSYGGIRTEKLAKARANAKAKIRAGAKV